MNQNSANIFVEKAVIYEANIRQYSPEGTFNAFRKDLPEIKKLGVNVLWIMPIHPIGEKNRKGTLGSYYSIKDYMSVNPEFGNLEDFKNLLTDAHNLGFKVILDWVANHTAWDHIWTESNPDYYIKNAQGDFISPYDWSDTIKLDYKNPDLRSAMREAMRYWIGLGIDGFRCDMAAETPTDFWNETTAELNKIKPLIWLAEAELPELFEEAFDIGYGWAEHHLMNDIAQKKKNIHDLDEFIKGNRNSANSASFLQFTSNHDENSWNGSEYERMENAVEIFAVLSFAIPGVPLIYNGQEYGFNRKLKFFDKDCISKKKGRMFGIYERLGKVKSKSAALDAGKNKAHYKKLPNSDAQHILSFKRKKADEEVLFVGNFSAQNRRVKLQETEGTYINFMSKDTEIIRLEKEMNVQLRPWEYWLFIKK